MEENIYELTDKEKELINLIRTLDYGEISVIIQEGQPVKIEEIIKSIKL